MSHAPSPGKDGLRWYASGFGPKRSPEDKTRCIQSVTQDVGRWYTFPQCSHKRGHGPDGLYCKRHAPTPVSELRTWYRTNPWSNEILPVLLAKMTEQFAVFPDGRREKREQGHAFFGSMRAALEALVTRNERNAETARRNLAEHTASVVALKKQLVKLKEET